MIPLIIKVLVIVAMDYIAVKKILINLILDYREVYKLYRDGKRASGVIISFITKEDLDQQNQYDSIIEFTAKDGCKYTINGNDSKYTQPEINKKVAVSYDADDPLNAIINPTSILQFKSVLILFVSLVILGVNVVLIC